MERPRQKSYLMSFGTGGLHINESVAIARLRQQGRSRCFIDENDSALSEGVTGETGVTARGNAPSGWDRGGDKG